MAWNEGVHKFCSLRKSRVENLARARPRPEAERRISEESGLNTQKILKNKRAGISKIIAKYTVDVRDGKEIVMMEMFDGHKFTKLTLEILHGGR